MIEVTKINTCNKKAYTFKGLHNIHFQNNVQVLIPINRKQHDP